MWSSSYFELFKGINIYDTTNFRGLVSLQDISFLHLYSIKSLYQDYV